MGCNFVWCVKTYEEWNRTYTFLRGAVRQKKSFAPRFVVVCVDRR